VKAGDVLVEIDPRDFAVRAAQARAVLAFLIGAPAVENPLVDGFEVPAVPDLAELQRQAAGARPDLAAARALIAAAEKGLGAAYAEYFPSISIDFDYFLTRQAFPQTSHWLFGASMYLPIFSGGRIHADVRTAHSLVRQAMYYQSMTERKAAEEVTVAWQSLQASGEKVKELGAAVSAASQAFQLADQAYDVGLATNLERLVAQDRLLQAELQLAAETLSRKTLYLRLVEAVGKLADEASSLASPPAKGLTAETAVKENGS
jgi:outer membrane protein TolC